MHRMLIVQLFDLRRCQLFSRQPADTIRNRLSILFTDSPVSRSHLIILEQRLCVNIKVREASSYQLSNKRHDLITVKHKLQHF